MKFSFVVVIRRAPPIRCFHARPQKLIYYYRSAAIGEATYVKQWVRHDVISVLFYYRRASIR